MPVPFFSPKKIYFYRKRYDKNTKFDEKHGKNSHIYIREELKTIQFKGGQNNGVYSY